MWQAFQQNVRDICKATGCGCAGPTRVGDGSEVASKLDVWSMPAIPTHRGQAGREFRAFLGCVPCDLALLLQVTLLLLVPLDAEGRDAVLEALESLQRDRVPSSIS